MEFWNRGAWITEATLEEAGAVLGDRREGKRCHGRMMRMALSVLQGIRALCLRVVGCFVKFL